MKEKQMLIRRAESRDLERIFEIYALAREFMKKTGNPDQWRDNKPSQELVIGDIEKGQSFVCEYEGEVEGVFAFIEGEDPTYKVIYEGAWLSDEAYAVIHRIASSGKVRGTGKNMMKWAQERNAHIRIDTHRDNIVMQSMLRSLGYKYCGIIHLEDGDERLAFEKLP